jgi:hypothetical protein
VQVAGVLITGGAGNGQLKSNKVTDLTCNTQAPGGGVLSGIYLAGGNHQVENNLVRIFNQTSGNPTTIRGIWDAAGPSYTINYYFNSVRIGGSQTTGTNADSYAFYRSAATSNILKNNNFTNFRESLPGSGKSYGIALPEVSGNIVLDYNNYFAGSAAGIMALYGAVEISSLPVINGQDVSSISDDPLFASENNMHPTGYHLNNKGIFVPGITTDQEGSVRTDPPDIGALEFSLFADLTTMEPADITISTATLKGMVNPKNETATGAFEYGTTISYGNSVAWLPASVSGAGGMLAEAQVGSLVPNTLYHFRINAATPAGTSYGPDQTFRTIPSSQSTFICTGAGLWSDGANWDMGVPGDVTDAIIPAGKEVTTDGQVVCDDLTINAGGAVTVGMGNRLQVKGNLLVDSDETGAGSLIAASEDVEVTGSATIRCFITGASESWHFLSSPVVDQQIAGEFTPSGSYPDGTGYDFYLWQESTGVWMNRKAPTWITANGHDQFQTGRGYLVAYEALNPVRQFSGALVSGQIEIPLTNTGSTSYRCFNLAGNPYCSSIDWKSPTGIDKTSLFNEPGGGCVIYIYNGAAGNYGVYHDQAVGDEGTNGVGRYIPPMQGFFVRAKADIQPCTMLINNEARVHEKPSWLKSQDVSRLGISVTDISSGLKDEVLFEFGHSITGGGAEKWFSLANRAPSLYHVKDGKKYSLVFLTSAGMSPELELSFKAGCAGNYRFTWAIVNLPGITWFLEDLQSGLVMDLSTQDEYCFYGSPGDQDGRFRLKQVPSSVEPSSTRKDFSIYYVSHGFIIMVHDSTVGQNEGKLNISDQSGRVVGTFGIEGGNPYRVDVILPPGIYIARLTMGNRSVISKVIVF